MIDTQQELSRRSASQSNASAACSHFQPPTEASFTQSITGTIRTWTDEAAELLGLSTKEAVGRQLADCLAPGGSPDLAKALQKLQAGQTPDPQCLSLPGPNGSGTMEVRLTWQLARGNDDRAEHAIVLVKLLENANGEELRLAAGEIHRLVAETVPYGLWICDRTGRCQYLTDSFLCMLGMSMEDAANHGWLSRVHDEDVRALRDALDTHAESDEPWEHEFRIQNADDDWQDILTRGRPFRSPSGETVWAGIHLDITERKSLERRLQELNDELEQRVQARTRQVDRRAQQLRRLSNELTRTQKKEREHLATILHDSLQQTLTAAVMRAHVLCKTQKPETRESVGPELRNLLQEAIDECRSLSAELRPGALQERSFADTFAWLAESMREKHQLSVDLELEGLRELENNDVKFQLFEAIRELLFNVVKHAGVQEATLSCMDDLPNYVHLVVSDNGVGMDASLLSKDSSSGSGLTSARNRLELMGGHLEIVSEHGKGCQVHLYAPDDIGQQAPDHFAEAHAEQTTEQQVAEADTEAKRSGKISIILADDHEIVRAGLSNLIQLEEDLIVLAEAEDGNNLLELAARLQPEVAIIDVNMPELNGVEATRALKERQPGIFVIALSVDEDPDTQEAMRRAGANGFYTKGSDFHKLCSLIRSVRPDDSDGNAT